jgi:hypothetical protein
MLVEPVGGDWKILLSTHLFEQTDASTFTLMSEVEANDATRVEYPFRVLPPPAFFVRRACLQSLLALRNGYSRIGRPPSRRMNIPSLPLFTMMIPLLKNG